MIVISSWPSFQLNFNSTRRLSHRISGFLFEHSFISRFRTFLVSFSTFVALAVTSPKPKPNTKGRRKVQAMNNGNKLNKLGKNHFLKLPPETRDNSLPASSFSLLLCNQISTIQLHKLCFLCCRWKGNQPQNHTRAKRSKKLLFNLIWLWRKSRARTSRANNAEGEQNDD